MRAILLARATAAGLSSLRLRSPRSQGEGEPLPRWACWITDMAPLTKRRRKSLSPARVITPRRVLPAVGWSLGATPGQAAQWPGRREEPPARAVYHPHQRRGRPPTGRGG